MILSQDEIRREISAGRIKVDPFDPANVGTASIDLTVASCFRRQVKNGPPIDLTGEVDYRDPELTELVEVEEGGFLEVAPQELVLGITLERVGLPDDLCGWFDGRSRFARLGLLVHVSAGFMQPGTYNSTVLEIYNVSCRPLRIYPGTPVCQFIFQKMVGGAKHSGRFSDQTVDVFRGLPKTHR